MKLNVHHESWLIILYDTMFFHVKWTSFGVNCNFNVLFSENNNWNIYLFLLKNLFPNRAKILPQYTIAWIKTGQNEQNIYRVIHGENNYSGTVNRSFYINSCGGANRGRTSKREIDWPKKTKHLNSRWRMGIWDCPFPWPHQKTPAEKALREQYSKFHLSILRPQEFINYNSLLVKIFFYSWRI